MKPTFRIHHGLHWRSHYWNPAWDTKPRERWLAAALILIATLWAWQMDRDWQEEQRSAAEVAAIAAKARHEQYRQLFLDCMNSKILYFHDSREVVVCRTEALGRVD
jgi:hypothetical protein